MMDVIFVYMTVDSLDEARRIGLALVEERLAACVNLIGGMASIYRWQDAVEEAQEVVMIAKTRADLFDCLEARVKELHSYDCPCIVALPVSAGHAPYLEWIGSGTQ